MMQRYICLGVLCISQMYCIQAQEESGKNSAEKLEELQRRIQEAEDSLQQKVLKVESQGVASSSRLKHFSQFFSLSRAVSQ